MPVFSVVELLCCIPPPLVMPHFLLTNLVPDRILSVNASIDTIGKILLKIIPTLEEVSIIPFSVFGTLKVLQS